MVERLTAYTVVDEKNPLPEFEQITKQLRTALINKEYEKAKIFKQALTKYLKGFGV